MRKGLKRKKGPPFPVSPDPTKDRNASNTRRRGIHKRRAMNKY
jgi:hypothetical protein